MEKLKNLAKLLFDRTFLRFVAVGVVNTLFGYAIMFVFYNVLHLNYWISSASNYVFGSILSYFLNKHFTFKDQSGGWKQAVRFAVNIGVCYLVAYGVARPLVRLALEGLSQKHIDNAAMLTGSVVFAGLNYLLQRFITFRKTEKKET